MGTPLKNQNFENQASSCFKLAQIRPKANMSLGLLVALENANKHTNRFMFYKYRYILTLKQWQVLQNLNTIRLDNYFYGN